MIASTPKISISENPRPVWNIFSAFRFPLSALSAHRFGKLFMVALPPPYFAEVIIWVIGRKTDSAIIPTSTTSPTTMLGSKIPKIAFTFRGS